MEAYIRCAAIALPLIGSGGVAAAQKYPTGSPGTNDNMVIAPGNSGSGRSIQSSAQNQTQKGTSSRIHARTVNPRNSGMSAQGSAATPTRRHVQTHSGGATQKHSGS
jgi:hypothetical protein